MPGTTETPSPHARMDDDQAGLHFVRSLFDETIERPPMARILPFELLAPELGKVMLVATPEPSFANTLQTVHGGWAMTMLDTSMNLAAHTTLKGRELAPTLETSVKFVRPISVDAGPLHVSGTVISRTRTVITLEGSITSREGKLFAHGTSTCMVVQA